MSQNKSINTDAVIIGRLDYGEKDRIISLVSPKVGKVSALAKSVRSSKSKLAGGIELFAVNQLVLLNGKSDLYTLISSRPEKYFSNIVTDIERSMYAYECFKIINKFTPEHTGEEYYQYLVDLLNALDMVDMSLEQIKIWSGLKLLKIAGASPNFVTDNLGANLNAESRYFFDFDKQCFAPDIDGPYDKDNIKILRRFDSIAGFQPINNCGPEVIEKSLGLIELIMQEYKS